MVSGISSVKGAVMRRLGWLASVCMLVVVGCSPTARERLKHFFFEIPKQEQPADAEPSTEPALESIRLVSAKPQYRSVHVPYQNRECMTCHDSSRRMAVYEDLLDSCASCHEPYFDEDKVMHSPVTDGECRECHVLHRSERRGLLKAPVFDLCTECHDSDDLDEDTCGTDSPNCAKCHDAHFGETALLRPGVEGAEE